MESSIVYVRWRPRVPHLIDGSLGTRESASKTASRSVQRVSAVFAGLTIVTYRQTDRQEGEGGKGLSYHLAF